ncbi:PREDICTED: ras-related protein Rab-18-like isoform X2 [Chrysochloris asiatica]|uniref:Ras-related protein Rab-18-like isoform X2 n=1 Tax=Chrysochloris asiatica TaxID=185453 RepID=A0A9B0TR77_CHRAS|nr:PREDICTED: ras-related protein Rab-18-like isoform X2 [Chrysochloris asiatica]
MDKDMLTRLKILIIDKSRVGKYSLPLRFTDDIFDPDLAATIGVDCKVKTISVDGNKDKLAIWDTENREVDRNEGLKFARKHSMLFIEPSAKTCHGVQCAFEETVEKITQAPGLWESENQNKGVKLLDREEGHGGGACGGYYSVL